LTNGDTCSGGGPAFDGGFDFFLRAFDRVVLRGCAMGQQREEQKQLCEGSHPILFL
jgi:hypothetical protein